MSIKGTKSTRSHTAAAVLLMALLASASSTILAQTWPTARPVKVIVPSAPGGSSDPLARMMAEELGGALGGTFIVENRPGGGGIVSLNALAQSTPDGYT